MRYVIPRLIGIFYLHAKFGSCRFNRSGDMIANVKLKMSTRPCFIGGLSSESLDLIYSTYVQNLTTVASAVPDISLGR